MQTKKKFAMQQLNCYPGIGKNVEKNVEQCTEAVARRCLILRTPTQVLSCELYEIFTNTIWTLPVAVSECKTLRNVAGLGQNNKFWFLDESTWINKEATIQKTW